MIDLLDYIASPVLLLNPTAATLLMYGRVSLLVGTEGIRFRIMQA